MAKGTQALKWCNRCKTAKPRKAFSKNRTAKDGLQAWCKNCARNYIRHYYQQPENQERKRAKGREYERQPEAKAKKAIYMAEYRQRPEVKERKNALARLKYGTDPEFRERERRKKREWRAEHKEEALLRFYRQVAKNPGAWRATKARYRARKHSAPINDLTSGDWLNVLAHYGHCCAYCGRKEDKLQQDHVIPLSLGGPHTVSNIVPACRSCNGRKGARTPSMAGMYLEKLPLVRWRL